MNEHRTPDRRSTLSTHQSSYGHKWSLWRSSGLLLGLFAVGLLTVSLAWSHQVESTSSSGSLAQMLTERSTAAEQESLATTTAEGKDAKDAELIWYDNFDAAMIEAAKRDLPMLLRFTASWCMPCQVMNSTVWPKEEVTAALAGRFIPVKVDMDTHTNSSIIRRYGVRGIPTIVVVDPQGNEQARGNFMSAEAMVEFIRSVRKP